MRSGVKRRGEEVTCVSWKRTVYQMDGWREERWQTWAPTDWLHLSLFLITPVNLVKHLPPPAAHHFFASMSFPNSLNCFLKAFFFFFFFFLFLELPLDCLERNHLSAFRPSPCLLLTIPPCLPPFLPSTHLSGGIFLALLHSFLLNCQAAAAAIPTLLPLSAHNLVLLATPTLSRTLHMANNTDTSLCVSVCACVC